MGIFDIFLSDDTKDRLDEAKKTNEIAEYIVEAAEEKYEEAQKSCEKALKQLDREKQKIYKGSIAIFAESFLQLNSNANFHFPKELQELTKYSKGTEFFYPYVDINTSVWSSSWGRDAATVAATVGLGYIGILGVRSYMKGKSKKVLDQANEAYEKATVVEAQYEAATDICGYIEKRAQMFHAVLLKLNEKFVPLVLKIQKAVAQKGTNHRAYNQQDMKVLAAASALALSIKSVLDVAIIDKKGMLTQESRKMAIEMSSQLCLPCDVESLGNTQGLPDEDAYDYEPSNEKPKLEYCYAFDRIVGIVSKRLHIDKSRINMYSNLQNDLGAKQSDIEALKNEIVSAFRIRISKNSGDIFATIESLADFVVSCNDDTFREVKYLASKAKDSVLSFLKSLDEPASDSQTSSYDDTDNDDDYESEDDEYDDEDDDDEKSLVAFKVIKAFAEVIDVDPAEVNESDTLEERSISEEDLAKFASKLEDEFSITIEDFVAKTFYSVGGVINYVELEVE